MAEGPSGFQPATAEFLKCAGVRFVILSTLQASNTGRVLLLPLGGVREQGISHGKSLGKARGFQDSQPGVGRGHLYPPRTDVRLWNPPSPAPAFTGHLLLPPRGHNGDPGDSWAPAVSEVTPDTSVPFPLQGDKTHIQRIQHSGFLALGFYKLTKYIYIEMGVP